MRRRSLIVAALALLVVAGSCVVESRCRTDDDCESPLVCGADRTCVIECASNDDCALEAECSGSRCLPAAGCAGCAFAHAEAICVHGACSMGDCDPGWVDLGNGDTDGCEYECTFAGAEACNDADDDCDGRTDEDFDTGADPAHCGACNRACPSPDHSVPWCESGDCGFDCATGWWDTDGLPENGCEADHCTATGDEVCDNRDNDCDGETDEGFDRTLPISCGRLCEVCDFDNAGALCVDGNCRLGDCAAGWWNENAIESDGCEYECTVTGAEVCDEEDNDCDGDTDEGLLCCPEEMVMVDETFCIDRWEASRPDATDSSFGTDPSYATSRPHVYPWIGVTLDDAAAACAAADKRLCNATEWVRVCKGSADTAYCYGTDYQPTTCNGIDAFGPGAFHIMPTESFASCRSDFGAYDMNGNTWEMTADGLVRGGAYNCGDSAWLHQCAFSTTPESVITKGFRCCL